MTLSPKLGAVGISTLWHFRLSLPIQMFIKVASSPRLSGIGMPSPILWSHPLKMQRIVLLSSLLWWELGTNSQVLVSDCRFSVSPVNYRDRENSINEPSHDKTNKIICAPSEDSDQPRHLPRLIRVFAVHMNKAWVLSYPLSTPQRLIRLGGYPGWSELRWAHSHFVGFVMRWLILSQECLV